MAREAAEPAARQRPEAADKAWRLAKVQRCMDGPTEFWEAYMRERSPPQPSGRTAQERPEAEGHMQPEERAQGRGHPREPARQK